MSNKRQIKQLQQELSSQTTELNLVHEKLAQRSYKLSKATLQVLHYQEEYLQEQVDDTQAQILEIESGDKAVKSKWRLQLKLVMITAICVALGLHLLLHPFS